MSPPYRLKTLGSLDVADGGNARVDSVAAQQKRLALLVYLAVEGLTGPVERDLVCAVFWPESDQTRARANLRKAVYFLRGALGQSTIDTIGGERLHVDPERVRCDAVTALREGVRPSGGTFLDGVHFRGATSEFYDWVESVRARIERLPVADLPRKAEKVEAIRPSVTSTPARGPSLRRTFLALGAVGILALGVSRVVGSGSESDGRSSEIPSVDRSRRVLVIPFQAAVNSHDLGTIASSGSYWFMRRMTGSGVADVIDYRSIAPHDSDFGSVDLLQAADSAFADFVVLGRASVANGRVSVDPRVVRVADLLAEVDLPPETAPLERPLEAFDQAADRVLAALAAELSPTWRWPPHNPPPSLQVMRLEHAALNAFYVRDYDRFHVLADSAMAVDPTYFPVVMLNHKASAYWNQRRVDPDNFRRADSVITYLESQAGRLGSGDRRGLQWMRGIVSGDLDSEFEAVSLPSIAVASERGPYRLAMSASRSNRLPLALELIDRRYLMHPRATRYVAWDQVYLKALLQTRDYEALRRAAVATRVNEPTYGLYLQREAQALAGSGDFASIDEVVDRARALPRDEEFNPAVHLVSAAEVAWAEGSAAEARELARRSLDEAAALPEDSIDVRRVKARAYGILGEWGEAVALLAELVREDVPAERRIERLGLYGAALAQDGRRDEAHLILGRLETIAVEYDRFYLRGLARWHQARIHAQLGNTDEAIRLIGESLESGQTHGEWEVSDIHLLPLRSDARYRDLIRIRP